jgi:hypothetical protein
MPLENENVNRTTFEERSQSWHRLHKNNSAVNLEQYHVVLDEIVLKLGTVVDMNGIDAGEIGHIDTDPGRVLQTTQYVDFVNAARHDPVYMAPGSGNLHPIPVDGDWLVGDIYEAQGQNEFIVFQTTIPVKYEESET